MSMSRKFKAAKIQLTLVGEKHPKGVKHVLNNVTENVSEVQLTRLCHGCPNHRTRCWC